MAFPVFHEVTSGSTATITNTFTVSWPATVNAGDELFLFISNDGNRAITGAETAGWTLVSSYTYSLKKASLFHIASAVGTETGTFDVTLTPTGFEGASWGIARFSGTDGTLYQYAETDGNSVSADPPASPVPTGGAKDYLFLAIANAFNQPVVTVFPTNYINTGQVSASTGGTTSAWATRALNTAVAEDPSTFTLGVSNPWHAGVVIIHPGAAGGRSFDSLTGALQRGATGVTANCTDLDTAPTVQIVTLTNGTHSDTCTITNWNLGDPIFTVDAALPAGNYDVQVTDDTGTVTLTAQTLLVETGYETVVYDGTAVAEPSETLQEATLSDHAAVAVVTDQWIVQSEANTTWAVDGTFVIDPAGTKILDYYFWDESAGTMTTLTALTIAQIPVLTLPGLTSTGATTQDGSVTTDTANGTLYGYWSQSITPPTGAGLKAGTGADFSDSQTVLAVGIKTFNATGLAAETTYYFHSIQENSGVDSTIATSSGVPTQAAAPGNSAPVFAGTVANQADARNIAISTLDLSTYFTDVDGDTLTYSVTTGVLPTGLNLDPNTGIISGTPTVLGTTAALVITATDPDLATDVTNSFSWEITNTQPALSDRTFYVADGSGPGTVIGTHTGTDANADTLLYSITAGNVSGDIAINASTGELSVAPGQTLNAGVIAVYTLTVQADDQTGTGNATDTATVTINVGVITGARRGPYSLSIDYVTNLEA